MQHLLKIGKLLENGTVQFESSKKFASSQVQNFEILNLNFEISKLSFAAQVAVGSGVGTGVGACVATSTETSPKSAPTVTPKDTSE